MKDADHDMQRRRGRDTEREYDHQLQRDSYVYSQNMLMGSGQTHMNVSSIHEAAGIVAGLHGGRKF